MLLSILFRLTKSDRKVWKKKEIELFDSMSHSYLAAAAANDDDDKKNCLKDRRKFFCKIMNNT